MARIFISHSCKVETSGEDERLTFARAVRDGVVERLVALGHEPLLDKDLKPGDDWRARLHRWLAECDGAVLLLDPLSVTSEWVLKEATILSWRRSLDPALLLVPIFMGELGPEGLAEVGFGALGVDQWQGVKLASRGTQPADGAALVNLAVAEFAAPAMARDAGPMSRWAEDVAALLARASAGHLERIREPLKLDEKDWAVAADRTLMLAHQLLHSELGTAQAVLEELKPGMPRDAFEQLIDQVLPNWVDIHAAAHFSAAVSATPRRPIVINAEGHDVARDYVSRAHFRLVNSARLIAATGVVGEGGVEELLPLYERAFIASAGQRPGRTNPLMAKPHLLAAFLEKPQKFVLLGVGAADPELLEQLQAKYQRAAFILLTGCHGADYQVLGTVIEPRLTQERVDEVDLLRLELVNLAA